MSDSTLHIGTLASNNVNNIVNDTSKYDEYKEKVKELEKELQTRKDTFEKMTEPLVYVCDCYQKFNVVTGMPKSTFGDSFGYAMQKEISDYIDRANQADLVSFLQSQGEQLTRAGNEYRWKRHDSLTVRGNKWYRHSQSKGGGPVDFVMEFFSKSFTEAVELLTGEKGAALPPDRSSPAPLSDFRLPPRSTDNRIARNYLTPARRIDEDVTGFFFSTGDIYEEDRKSTRLNSSH